jgi:ketosteroid isomerase-like protein
MTKTLKTAQNPAEITSLFVERANSKDVDGLLDLYEPDAVLAFPPGQETVGHDALREVLQGMIDHAEGPFELEEPAPTIYFEDIAVTSTQSKDDTGTRIQVVRRQSDGSWRRIIDRPEARGN